MGIQLKFQCIKHMCCSANVITDQNTAEQCSADNQRYISLRLPIYLENLVFGSIKN